MQCLHPLPRRPGSPCMRFIDPATSSNAGRDRVAVAMRKTREELAGLGPGVLELPSQCAVDVCAGESSSSRPPICTVPLPPLRDHGPLTPAPTFPYTSSQVLELSYIPRRLGSPPWTVLDAVV